MVSRRDFLGISAGGFIGSVAGCIGELLSDETDQPSLGTWIPRIEATGAYAETYRDDGKVLHRVDIEHLQSQLPELSSDARSQFGHEFPVIYGMPYSDIGLTIGDIEDVFIASTPPVNAFPRGVNSLGNYGQVVTTGEFDSNTVLQAVETARDDAADVHSLLLEGERSSYEGFEFISDGQLSVAINDNVIIGGFNEITEAAIDSERGEIDSYPETEPIVSELATELAESTFFAISPVYDPAETDVEQGEVTGKIVQGDGYRFTDEMPEYQMALVFENEDDAESELIEDSFDESSVPVEDPDTRVEENVVLLEGVAETDVLPYHSHAFNPFAFASRTPS